MRSFSYCLAAFVIIMVMLAGCTRNRPVPEASSQGSVSSTQGDAPVLLTPAVADITSTVSSTLSAAVEPQVATVTPEAGASNNANADAASGNNAAGGAPAGTAADDAAASGAGSIQYTVRDGDTLLSIAAQYGTTVDSLRQLNFLVDDAIQTGQVLRVPLAEGVTPAGVATATPQPYLYAVQPGDTLYGIALQFGVDATAIIEANGLLDQNSLIVGSNLIIPGYEPAAGIGDDTTGSAQADGATEVNQVAYVVEPGDTLYSIAETYGVDAASIAAANGIQNWELLRVGQQLFIPGITPEEAAAINQVIHVVQPGQGLIEIAVQYGVSTEEIVRLNNIQDTDIIYPGQRLIIPGN